MSNKAFLCAIFCLSAMSNISGQLVTPDDELEFTVEDFILPGGRLGNNVNAIVEGPYGFLWFGSHGGLHRYDGDEFVTYKNEPNDTIAPTSSLTFPYVENLYWDKDDILWVTTYGEGLYRFDPRTEIFKHFTHDPEDSTSISHSRVMCAGEDPNGDLWFGTLQGLNRFDRETELFTAFYPFDSDKKSRQNDIRNLYVDRANNFWIAAGESFFSGNSGGLARYDFSTGAFIEYRHDQSETDLEDPVATRPLLEDQFGNFWVGTSFGLTKLNRESKEFEKMSYAADQPHAPGEGQRETPSVFSLLEDKNGGLWVGTVGDPAYPSHLLRYDPFTQKIQHLPVQSSAWHLCESSDGTLWVAGASLSGRVLKITPRSQMYDLQGGDFYSDLFEQSQLGIKLLMRESDDFASGNGPINIAIDSSGIIWGTHIYLKSLGASRFQPHPILSRYRPSTQDLDFFHLQQLKLTALNVDAPELFAEGSLAIGKEGKVWGSFSSDSVGVFSFDPISQMVEQYRYDPNDTSSLSSNKVSDLLVDGQGEVWVATIENGLNRINPKTKKITKYNFNYPAVWPNNSPMALEEDPAGRIWIGGQLWHRDTALIFSIDPITNIVEKVPLLTPRNSMITSLAFGPDARYLAMTLWENGVGIIDMQTLSAYYHNSQVGFPLDQTTSVLSDNAGNFWIGDRDQGTFARLSPDDQIFIFQNKNLRGSQHRKAVRAPNGHLFFLNDAGWAEIDPEVVRPDRLLDSSQLQMVDLYVLGEKQIPRRHPTLDKPIWMCEQVQLPHEAETFAFRFANFDFQSTESSYQYRLYPYESIWRQTNNEPIANYYKVPNGAYQFQVRSIRRTRNLRNQELTLKVIILPPWWHTWWAYSLYALLFIAASWLVHRDQKAKTIRKERERTRDRDLAQAKEIEKAYTQLKATQAQLIHAEKMASLGELTAGIAHEIQNPLNFVNNFSEVNGELLEEMNEEIENGNLPAIRSLAANIVENERKIVHHGKRADAIVKNMLQHSRNESGEKRLVDINRLLEEYLQLAYHGMRAKSNQFNAELHTSLDETLPNISINAQEMGRVILNLISNAFQALHEKATIGSQDNFQPHVWVSSEKISENIAIKIRDNGPGIAAEIKEKIFQPFFTTKPTSQGTGLGLSLSYDIVKAHRGELTLDTDIGQGTTFTIKLPIKSKTHENSSS